MHSVTFIPQSPPNRRRWLTPLKPKVLVAECEQIRHVRIQHHRRQRPWGSGQLLSRRRDMIGIQVRVTHGVHEVARLQIDDLRHHRRQESKACTIEQFFDHADSDCLRYGHRESAVSMRGFFGILILATHVRSTAQALDKARILRTLLRTQQIHLRHGNQRARRTAALQ